MADSSEEGILETLASVKKSMEVLSRNLSEALRKLEEAVLRISSLGEVHIRLITTLMDILSVPEDQRPALDFPSAPIEAASLSERSEAIVSGLLRIIIKSLTRPCGEISKALIAAKDRINVAIGNFDTYEMEILARMLTKDPERYLDSEEQIAYRDKIRKWHRQLKEAFERP
jgi:hypothetical protein